MDGHKSGLYGHKSGGVSVRTCDAGVCHTATTGADGQCRTGANSTHTTSDGCTAAGKSCNASCPTGYASSGDTTFTCVSNDPIFHKEEWSSGQLVCTLNSCPRATSPPLPGRARWARNGDPGSVYPLDRRFLPAGAVWNATCSPGFFASRGTGVRTCHSAGANGAMGWSGEPLVCTQDDFCPHSQLDTHSYWADCDFRCDVKCHNLCEPGYQRANAHAPEYTCTCANISDDGHHNTWKGPASTPCLGCRNATSGIPLRCDCDYPPVEGARSCRGMAGEPCIDFTCHDGYHAASSDAPHDYTCTANKTWSGGTQLCQRDVPAVLPEGFWAYLVIAICGIVVVCVSMCAFRRSRPIMPDVLMAATAVAAFSLAAIASGASSQSWDLFCVAVTATSTVPVPFIIRRYERTLGQLSDPQLPERKTYLGPFGFLLFIYGLVDVVVDVMLCNSLLKCGLDMLFCCVVSTLVVTTLMTWYLGWSTLRHVVASDGRPGSPAKAWLSDNPILGPAIVLASSSRLNSMAILRLRMCGTMLIDFPDSADHRFFHFLRHAGMYHVRDTEIFNVRSLIDEL